MKGSYLGLKSFFFKILPLITIGLRVTLLSTLFREATRKGLISIFALMELKLAK